MPLQKLVKKRLRKKSLQALPRLKEKAWKVFALWIKNRDGWKCITCGKVDKSSSMHAGHYIHGDHMDFVEKNISAQCVACNKWRHGNGAIYAVKLDERYGVGTAREMYLLSREYRGYRRADFEEVIRKYSV